MVERHGLRNEVILWDMRSLQMMQAQQSEAIWAIKSTIYSQLPLGIDWSRFHWTVAGI